MCSICGGHVHAADKSNAIKAGKKHAAEGEEGQRSFEEGAIKYRPAGMSEEQAARDVAAFERQQLGVEPTSFITDMLPVEVEA